MAQFSGLSGSLSLGGVTIAKIKNWTFTTSTNHPDASAKGDTYGLSVKGRTTGTWSAEMLWDSVTPTPANADITSATVLAAVFNSGASGSLKISCNVWVDEREDESPDEDLVSTRYTGKSDGTITFGTVA